MQIDTLVESLTVGGAQGALWALLNEKATRLKAERDGLLFEQRRLQESLAPLDNHFDAGVQRSLLLRFGELAGVAEPEELQRLLRLMVRRVEWEPDGAHRVQFYHLQKPNCLSSAQAGRQWFQTVVCNDIPSRRNLEPLIFEVHYHADDTPNLDFTRVMRPKAQIVGGESRRVSQAVHPAVLHPNQEKEVA